jgi:S-DNA-T family DNA segregation ATPase FtsK/SpoIIIE
MMRTVPPLATLAGLLAGLWLLVVLGGGVLVLAGHLLARLIRTRRDRRHPDQAAARQRRQHTRRLAAEWPLLAQTLSLGYKDQWTRQHRFPAAEFTLDDQGITATVAAIAGAGLADYQRAAGYLADTWGCIAVRAEQPAPGLIRLRGLDRDPLLVPARIELSGMAPSSLTSWWLGWAEDSTPVTIRMAEVSGIVVAGLAGFGRTTLVAHFLGQLAPSPAVQFVLIDGKGGPDYDRLFPRAWLSAKDDLNRVREVLRRVHRLMGDRQGAIAQVLGVTDAWHQGPSPFWPLVVVVIDEAHTFFHERKGTSPEVKAHNALVAELSRLVEELIRKGRNVAVQVMLLTQRATGDAIPTRTRDNCQVAISFATRTLDGAVAALGEEIRQHPDASPVLLNDPAYVGMAVTSLPGGPASTASARPRSTTTRSRPSSAPPLGCALTRRCCWPSRHLACGSSLGCRRREMQHELGRLEAGRRPANQGRRLPIRPTGVRGWFRRSLWSRRLGRSRGGRAAPAGARPRGAGAGSPG